MSATQISATEEPTCQRPTRGRPRAFDACAGRQLAARRFARDGFEGVCVADLCAEMGINPPSFYAAFGSKEALFRDVLAEYVAMTSKAYAEAIEGANTPRDLRHRVLRTAVGLFTRDGGVGCMVLANLMQKGGGDPMVAYLQSILDALNDAMLTRLQALGLPLPEAEALVRTVAVAMLGLSAAARSGMDRAALDQVVDDLVP